VHPPVLHGSQREPPSWRAGARRGAVARRPTVPRGPGRAVDPAPADRAGHRGDDGPRPGDPGRVVPHAHPSPRPPGAGRRL
ncbi:MAG: hypothetical protein AVDCRST_MAG49-592, partial [uncultured Thermomicrobiales bacterium]